MITIKKILAPAVLSLALAIGFTGMKAEAAPSVTRIDGGSGGRIQTADNLAKTQFTSSQNVILVYGYNYADAVSATPLAKQLDAPILITKGDELESEVADTIKSLGAKKVYIVGGSGVVSDNVENKLKGSGYDVERIAGYTDADGNVDTTRTGTNAAVAKKSIFNERPENCNACLRIQLS